MCSEPFGDLQRRLIAQCRDWAVIYFWCHSMDFTRQVLRYPPFPGLRTAFTQTCCSMLTADLLEDLGA